MKLSKKQREAVLEAAELVDQRDFTYCCIALAYKAYPIKARFKDQSLKFKFCQFYDKPVGDPWWDEDRLEARREKNRQERVLALLFFREATK